MEKDSIAVCTQHLQTIGCALDDYQRDHGELPPHLSDLYPHYVPDPSVFHCPADSSLGHIRVGSDNPKVHMSYLYEFTTHPAPSDFAVPFSPEQPRKGATWRECKQLSCRYFGDRVPVVSCRRHEWDRLFLPLSGQVYRSRYPRNWEDEPASLAVPLVRIEQDLTVGLSQLTRNWSLRGIAEFFARRLDVSLSPALRYLLGILADRLSAMAKDLPNDSQGDAHHVAAIFYRGAGQIGKALVAAEEALRFPDYHEERSFLRMDLLYRTKGKQGTPPVDDFLKAELVRQRIPGMSVAIVRNGKVILAKGYGIANVRRSVPVTQDTIIQIASITKSFTATGMMILVEQGKVGIDDPISQYVPDSSPAWKDVTIRHLLTHTSGISSDWSKIPSDQRQNAHTPEGVIRCMAQVPVEFPPGERYAYCNTGYMILGRIIEVVSGKSLDVFLDEHIFRPLQMTSTARGFTDLNILSTGYYMHEGTLKESNPWLEEEARWAWGNGWFVSTVMDMAKWDAALYTEEILRQSSLAQMWTPAKLDDGSETNYGFGWVIERFRGHSVVWHNGGGGGCSTVIKRLPERKLTVIVLTNCDGVNEQTISDTIIRYYLPAPKPVKDKDPKTTRKLKRVLLNLLETKANPVLFTSEAYAALSSEIKEASAFYQSLGPPKSFRVIEQMGDEKQRTYRYRTAFRNTTWIHSFVMTEEGKIMEISVEPE